MSELNPTTTKKQLNQVLGMFSYYRTYVPDFAAIAKPLTDLTAKRQPFMLQWGAHEQSAFEILRAKISEAPDCVVGHKARATFSVVHRCECYKRSLSMVPV